MSTATADEWWGLIIVFSLCLLGFKIFAITFYTSYMRKKHQIASTPEDVKFLKGGNFTTYTPVDRVLTMHRNDVENYVPFIFAVVASIYANVTISAQAVFIAVFLIARVLHTISFAFELQPWRAIFFLIGLIDTVVFYVAAMTYSVYDLFQ